MRRFLGLGGRSFHDRWNHRCHVSRQIRYSWIDRRPYQPQNWNNRVFLAFMRDLQKAHPEIPKLSAHEIRHTRATLWTESLGPYMAARLLGHSDLKMLLKIYDHTNVDTLKKAMKESKTA